jgi:N-acetylglutamate synthase-like GNAT family acetyltransferase
MPGLQRVGGADVDDLLAFLTVADLSVAGLDSPRVHLWVSRDGAGRIVGSTGYELSETGDDVLIRSVAVDPAMRRGGVGSELAAFAIAAAAASGARRAWLFSRRSGGFWQKHGFEPADRFELAVVLAGTHQVELFRESGRLETEVAWSRVLG